MRCLSLVHDSLGTRSVSRIHRALLLMTCAVVLDRVVLPNLSAILYFIGMSSSIGTTFGVAMMADLLSLTTIHLYAYYIMITAVFRFHSGAIGSLYNIFRGESNHRNPSPYDSSLTPATGKKYNVMRNRTEPSDYRLDQLLISAVLFTVAAFLFPTVLAYYLVLAAVSPSCITLHF